MIPTYVTRPQPRLLHPDAGHFRRPVLLYRRLFRARLATESTALLATVLAAVVSTPLVLLALLWLASLLRANPTT